MSSLRVLMYGWEFPPHNTGGLGVACHGMTKEMSGHDDLDVTLVLPKGMDFDGQTTPNKIIFSPNKKSIKVRSFDTWLDPYSNEKSYQEYITNLDEPVEYQTLHDAVMGYANVAEEIVQTEDFDLIHGHDWLTFPACIKTKQLSDKPMVAHVHATEIDRTGSHGDKRIFEIEKHGMQEADEVVCVSDYTRKTVISEYDIDSRKVSVVHNGIDKNETEFDDQNQLYQQLNQYKEAGYQIVLFVGRLTFQKGVDYLLHAAKKVLSQNSKTMFVVVGKGDMEKKLIEIASHLKISDRVMFPGWTQGENLRALYTLADVFIMPSVSEPFGLVALEAAYHNTPLILSKNSGVCEVLNHALKIDFWDIDKTAEYIVGVLNYPTLKRALMELSFRELSRTGWGEPVNKLKHIYNKLIHLD